MQSIELTFCISPIHRADGKHLALSLTWAALFAGGSLGSIRVNIGMEKLTSVMNVMAAAAVLLPFMQISRYELQRFERFAGNPMLTAPQINPALPDDMKPDIYYIILYGYARSDTLAELYAFDNSSFLSFLENQIR